jgi:hypothetical protein
MWGENELQHKTSWRHARRRDALAEQTSRCSSTTSTTTTTTTTAGERWRVCVWGGGGGGYVQKLRMPSSSSLFCSLRVSWSTLLEEDMREIIKKHYGFHVQL